ncbi:hypothetical protein COD67_02750 [Bacillus cereus]|nr:hypothetical protein COI89_01830 [Bacillus cereus]PGU70378.1 hypothetical protein COD67_02750 [Bacillus cereus]
MRMEFLSAKECIEYARFSNFINILNISIDILTERSENVKTRFLNNSRNGNEIQLNCGKMHYKQ